MITPLARLGFVSKAVIYAVVGGLALAAAARAGGRVTDTSGALRFILRQPYGQALLIVLAIGLCGYSLWRLLDAYSDPDRHGRSLSGMVVRIGHAIRGVVYGVLGIEAFRLAYGLRGSNGREAQLWTARIMDLPFGDWLIGLAGLIIFSVGASEVLWSLKAKIDASLDLTRIPGELRNAAINVSRFGVGARGIIISVLGMFLVKAALEHDPSEVHGTRQSILELANAVSGRWMLAAIGAGLIAYAIDQVLHARCRRIRPVI
jgi:uncharacterized protein DUF1206